MTKTIESMWKDGFMQETDLSAPKINDLYNKKSQHITDKLKRMYRTNIKLLIIGLPLGLVIMTIAGMPFLGLYMALMFGYIILEGKKQMKSFDALDQGQNCYQYVTAVNQSFKDMSEHFINIYKKFYPLLFVGIFIQFLFSESSIELSALLVEKVSQGPFLFEIHYLLYVIGALLTGFFYLIGGAIGKFDIDLVYKRIADKLDSLQKEMETLR